MWAFFPLLESSELHFSAFKFIIYPFHWVLVDKRAYFAKYSKKQEVIEKRTGK